MGARPAILTWAGVTPCPVAVLVQWFEYACDRLPSIPPSSGSMFSSDADFTDESARRTSASIDHTGMLIGSGIGRDDPVVSKRSRP